MQKESRVKMLHTYKKPPKTANREQDATQINVLVLKVLTEILVADIEVIQYTLYRVCNILIHQDLPFGTYPLAMFPPPNRLASWLYSCRYYFIPHPVGVVLFSCVHVLEATVVIGKKP